MSTYRVTVSCRTVGCRRRPTTNPDNGLCRTCNDATTDDRESPLVLTDGTWARRGNTRVWIPNPPKGTAA